MWRPAARAVTNVERMAWWIGRSKSAGSISTRGVPCTSADEMRFIECRASRDRAPRHRHGRRPTPRRAHRPGRRWRCHRARGSGRQPAPAGPRVRPARCTAAPLAGEGGSDGAADRAAAAVDHCIHPFQQHPVPPRVEIIHRRAPGQQRGHRLIARQPSVAPRSCRAAHGVRRDLDVLAGTQWRGTRCTRPTSDWQAMRIIIEGRTTGR